MVRVVKDFVEILRYWLTEYSDPRTDDWWLVGTPLPIAIISILYILVSVWLGPALMRNRKPFDLRKVIVVYNFFQVIANGTLFAYSLYWSYLQPDFDMLCEMTTPPTDNSESAKYVLLCAYGYLLLKMADYMDTMFFVLRKQKSHISFLHLYHHSLMGLVGYIGVRFAPGGNGAILVLANTLVHTVMYTYYLLSAMPSTRDVAARYKKHITQLQLVQFLCIGSHYSQAYFNVNCPFPNFLCIGLVVQNTFMAAMFADFYVRTYWREPKPQHAKRVEAAAAATNGKVANGINGVGQPINGSALNGHIKNGHAGSL